MATVSIRRYVGKTKTSYIVRFKDPATQEIKHYKTFHRKKDAQKAANDLRFLIDTGKVKQVKKNKVKRELLTYEKVTASLIETWRDKLTRKDLSPVTFEDYSVRAKVLNRKFGKKLLCEFTEDDIAKFHNQLFIEQSAACANRYLFNIKQVFKHASLLGALSEDPTKNIKMFNEDVHQRNEFLGPEAIFKLVDASQQIRAKFYMPALIFLGAEHGTSRQEALSLVWKDINFDFEETGLIRFFRTKNKHERTEYLMPQTRQALIDWKDHLKWMRHRKRIRTIRTDIVFCRLDGTPISSFRKAWKNICKIAGIKNFNYHDLRHTFCSNLILTGSDLKDVKDMIGHKDLAMTDRYSHLTIKHKRARQKELAKYYSNGDPNNTIRSSGWQNGGKKHRK